MLQIYLSYAWADNNGFAGIANFLFAMQQQRSNHMMKILEYILNRGVKAKVSAIPAPATDP
jgi:ferritin